MPLVRIDVIKGRSEKELTQLADVIQEVLIETFAAPELATTSSTSIRKV